jgi:hypothetical protein
MGSYSILSRNTNGALIALHFAFAALGTRGASPAGSQRQGQRNSSAVEQGAPLEVEGGGERQGCHTASAGGAPPGLTPVTVCAAKKSKQGPSLSQQRRRKQLHPSRSCL